MNWLDKYKDGGEFLGTTNKGFDYNGAWRGQFQDGGYVMGTYFDEDVREKEPSVVDETYDDYNTAMRGMIKSKIGMGNAFNHPAIKRMSQVMPKTGMTPEGVGTHYMSSVDNYAVPLLQDLGEEELTLVDPDPRSREAIRFNSPEEAEYFAKHYKEVAPMSTIFKDFTSFQTGGSIPGSVGFTYARTNNPAPSNGPYAKKTKASAQKGKAIPKFNLDNFKKKQEINLREKPREIVRDNTYVKNNDRPDLTKKEIDKGNYKICN